MNDSTKHAQEDPSAPVTRGEFNEAMAMIADAFKGVVTKAELNELLTELRTELRSELLSDMQTMMQTMMHSMEARLGGKIDDLFRHIDTAVEDRQVDLGAAKSEIVELHGERLDRHNERIEVLEKSAGIAG